MAGSAAGGFVARAFESMLKECANKKYSALQSAIQTYFDNGKEFNQDLRSGVKDGSAGFVSGVEKVESGDNHLTGVSSSAGESPTHGLPNSVGPIAKALTNAGHTLDELQVDLVLNPLRIAFETKNVKLVELALDCLHKLIEYNHLEGDPGLDSGTKSKVLADILNMVCSCIGNSTPDSTTLQVLKVLLTSIASTKIRVHGDVLLSVISVCFNVALSSKSPINQATSKAMVAQMLAIIFRLLESDGFLLVQVPSDSDQPREANSEDSVIESDEPSYSGQSDPRMAAENLLNAKQINTKSPSYIEEIRNLDCATDVKVLGAILKKAVSLEQTGKTVPEMDPSNMDVKLCDALLVFRTLCEMGLKEGNDEAITKTRILALELLQGSLEDVALSKSSPFIDSIRAHLSYALLRASVSESAILFQCAVEIFSVLLLRLRENLKAEIQIFFPAIVLQSFDGSDPNRKLIVLRMMEKICKDPYLLVDLYINYDCDPGAPNLFEKMVIALSRISQGTLNMEPKSSATLQFGSVKTLSLQVLVNALKSLVIWEKSLGERGIREESFAEILPGKLDEPKSTDNSPRKFDHHDLIGTVISEFNQNSVKGIHYLISSQLVDKSPASVGQFLCQTPNLNKTMIGDYLGRNEEFPTAVLHAYAESMNFSGMKFHVAVHEFLEGFQLPQEAQKIDRIVEKFSERYCTENPGVFKNADAAYVLAIGIIMLGANCDSSSRMSKSDFVYLSSRHDGEDSAPKEILNEAYDAITVDSALNSKDIKEVKIFQILNTLNLSLPKSRSINGSKMEKSELLKQMQILMKGQDRKVGVYYISQRNEFIYPMVEALGWPLLATFSVIMGEVDNDSRINLCMEGFKEGTYLTHALEMDTMRCAFLTSLLRYNFLHAPRDMRDKNVEALRALLHLCDTNIHALQESWFAVLECISRLEYIVSWPPITATIMQGSNRISRDSILQSLRELSGKQTEQVFINSMKLPSESVVEFFTALCGVSAEELKQNPARTFSLQKVVEISYDNMARLHMVWTRIWSIVSLHFIHAAGHADEKVAMYAVDSLRQLIMTYLDHTELPNFSFQKAILKPFAILMQRSRTEALRKLLLNSIVQIIKSKVAKLKSGWQSIFMIFAAAADDDMEPMVERAFENVEQVILGHFDHVFRDCFMDCMNCLIGFMKNRCSPSISLKAIALLRMCENRLAEGLICNGSPKPADCSVNDTCRVAEQYWYPMLAGLSGLTSDSRSEVRNCAVEVLFDLLNERGNNFSSSFWETIFQQVLFPVFDNIRKGGKDFIPPVNERARESSVHSLKLLCNLFSSFYKEVRFMLPQLLSLLLDCAKKSDQLIVSMSLGALVQLIEVGGHQFTDTDWSTLLESISDVLYTTQPLELLNDLDSEKRRYQHLVSGVQDWPSTVSLQPAAVMGTGVDAYEMNYNQGAIPHAVVGRSDEDSISGMISPSTTTIKSTGQERFQRSQSLGQRIMGNMKENLLLRSFTSKPKTVESDEVIPPSPVKNTDESDAAALDMRDEEESPALETIRTKCVTQLLLLGAIDCIQVKYWNKLNKPQKTTMMDILYSVLEFAASYNSYINLRSRMHQIPPERPPSNLFRQEFTGTCIYLDILHKTTAAVTVTEEAVNEKLEGAAEEKLVSFCEQILREASDFLSGVGETNDMKIFRVAELRSPIIVKVLKSMSAMNPHIFRVHLSNFYPSITKLICCDQMEVRGALADLLTVQFTTLLNNK